MPVLEGTTEAKAHRPSGGGHVLQSGDVSNVPTPDLYDVGWHKGDVRARVCVAQREHAPIAG